MLGVKLPHSLQQGILSLSRRGDESLLEAWQWWQGNCGLLCYIPHPLEMLIKQLWECFSLLFWLAWKRNNMQLNMVTVASEVPCLNDLFFNIACIKKKLITHQFWSTIFLLQAWWDQISLLNIYLNSVVLFFFFLLFFYPGILHVGASAWSAEQRFQVIPHLKLNESTVFLTPRLFI